MFSYLELIYYPEQITIRSLQYYVSMVYHLIQIQMQFKWGGGGEGGGVYDQVPTNLMDTFQWCTLINSISTYLRFIVVFVFTHFDEYRSVIYI